jgi:hypothetical protein
LTKLEPDWWLELENTYKSRIAQRRSLYEKHGKSVLQHLPGSELACKELMEMALQFLCARYPQYFVLSNNNKTLENKILGNVQDLTTTHPLIVILDNVPEDFAVMLRNPETGYYHFRAGVICSALGWNLGTKIGLQLHQIHAPIPDYKERMQFSMDRLEKALSRKYLTWRCAETNEQIFCSITMRPTDSARLLGPRSRPAALHASERSA